MNRIILCVLLVAGAIALIANIATGFVAPEAEKWNSVPDVKWPDKTEQTENADGSFVSGKSVLHIDFIKRELIKTDTGNNPIPKQIVGTSIKDRLELVFYLYDKKNPENSTATIYEKEANGTIPNKSRGSGLGMTPSFTKPSFNPRRPSQPNSGRNQSRSTGRPKKYVIDADNRMIGEHWIVAEFREDGLLIKQVNGEESFLLLIVNPVGNKSKANP